MSARYMQYRSSLANKVTEDEPKRIAPEQPIETASPVAVASPPENPNIPVLHLPTSNDSPIGLTADSSKTTTGGSRFQNYRATLAQRLRTVETSHRPPAAPEAPDVPPARLSVASSVASSGGGAPDPRYQKYRSSLAEKITKSSSPSLHPVAHAGTEVAAAPLAPSSPPAAKPTPRYQKYRSQLAAILCTSNDGADEPSTVFPVPLSTSLVRTATPPADGAPRYTAYRTGLAKSVSATSALSSDQQAALTNGVSSPVSLVADPLASAPSTVAVASISRASTTVDGGSLLVNAAVSSSLQESLHMSDREESSESTEAVEDPEPEADKSLGALGEARLEEKELENKLSNFLSKNEKWKPPIPAHEMDMHTSWSDFDTADLHGEDRKGRKPPDLLAKSISAQEQQLSAQEQKLQIQQAIAASSTYKNRKEGIREEIKKARLRGLQEAQVHEAVQQARSGTTTLDSEISTNNKTTDGTTAEPDIENGLNSPEQEDQPEHTERSAISEGRTLEKKLAYPCLAFLWIVFVVIALVLVLR
jgi:rRNA maturation protein Nop10